MIVIPGLFLECISRSSTLSQAVSKNFEIFEPWLEQSGMPLFPGFTDHSPRHLNDVLKTAASIVSDAARPLLTAEDVAVLCTAVLLHDCGMHLTQDGFRALVASESPPLIMGLHDRPWTALWKEFLAEANRFSEAKLVAIFGYP